jgi:hypothetical protein
MTIKVKTSIPGSITLSDSDIGTVKITFGYEEITPALAEKYLIKNIQNRNLEGRRVASYIAEMTNGLWKPIPGAIAFDENENLINGQHTLNACKRSGVAIISEVTRGIPREYCMAMDAGKKKTLTNHSQMLGRPERSEHFKIAKLLELGYDTHKEYTNAQQIELIEKYWDAVNFAVSLTKGVKYMHAPLVAMIARASYTQDHGRLRDFVSVFRSGLAESKHDWAAVRLRRYMVDEVPPEYFRVTRSIIYLKAEAALSAFLRKYALKGNLLEVKRELYLLPGESQETADTKLGLIKHE